MVNMSFNAIRDEKILARISDFTENFREKFPNLQYMLLQPVNR